MAVNEKYLSFVEICKKPGVYCDKTCGLYFKIVRGEVLSKGRDGKWEPRQTPVKYPNKKRFLRFSDRQAKRL